MAEMENSDAENHQPATKKRRNQPGMPDPDAEVIALSPTTLLATNRFICEVCNRGFQREQNLQLHRRGHHLPWKLRQRNGDEVKKKRVYVCPESSCIHNHPSRALGDLTGIKKHFCRKHGDKKHKCETCPKIYAVQSDCKAHMKICGSRQYRCDCGILFSRKDSFVTHRAFCGALARESTRIEVANGGGGGGVSYSPPPPPLTPSSRVLSPVLSIQTSAELPENQIAHFQSQSTKSQALFTSMTTVTTTTEMAATTSGGGVFASIFESSSSGEPAQPCRPPATYPDLLCTMTGSACSNIDPNMSLSLSSSLYLETSQDQNMHYASSPLSLPALSATALLQRAAEMSATSANSSFLHSLCLAMPNAQDNFSITTSATIADPALSGLSDKPITLDFLGLGMGANEASSGEFSGGFSTFLTSMGGGSARDANLGVISGRRTSLV